jgi:hypothetical protein
MKFDWQQLSPREREVLLRHFLLKRAEAEPVTADRVCAAMQKTHHLSCHTDRQGKTVIRFLRVARGVRSAKSVADELSEGIYKAALRAKGVDVEDGFAAAQASRQTRARPVRAI